MAAIFSRKVAAFVIRRSNEGVELLVHGFGHDADLPWRVPGGGINDDESLHNALFRELSEEAGINGATIVRALGTVRFFKTYSNKFVERHDFLLSVDQQLPAEWTYVVRGSGADAGEFFNFRWIKKEEFYRVDIELQKFLDESHLPELFSEDLSNVTSG